MPASLPQRNGRLRSRRYKGAVHRPLICVVFCLFGVLHGYRNKGRLVDVWVGVRDPRQATKVEHDLIELPVVAVSGVLSGADTFVEIVACAKVAPVVRTRHLVLRGMADLTQARCCGAGTRTRRP